MEQFDGIRILANLTGLFFMKIKFNMKVAFVFIYAARLYQQEHRRNIKRDRKDQPLLHENSALRYPIGSSRRRLLSRRGFR